MKKPIERSFFYKTAVLGLSLIAGCGVNSRVLYEGRVNNPEGREVSVRITELKQPRQRTRQVLEIDNGLEIYVRNGNHLRNFRREGKEIYDEKNEKFYLLQDVCYVVPFILPVAAAIDSIKNQFEPPVMPYSEQLGLEERMGSYFKQTPFPVMGEEQD